MMDAANAVACHNELEVTQARARIHELAGAIKRVRSALTQTVIALEETSDHLSALARASNAEADKASKAADETAINVDNMASVTEQLSASISQIHRQATQSADVSRGTVIVFYFLGITAVCGGRVLLGLIVQKHCLLYTSILDV